MDIECQGCYYTVCSFICLTEDLSEILQFLWRHGCLRRSYLCEKCGRKCAIGDKDLFFRCNRNTLETPVLPKTIQNLPEQSSSSVSFQKTCQVQTSGSRQNISQHNEQIHPEQFEISHLSTLDNSQANSPFCGNNNQNFVQFNHDKGQHNSGLLYDKSVACNTINLTLVPNIVLDSDNLNQGGKILTVIDQGNKLVENRKVNTSLIPCENSNVLVIPVPLQVDPNNSDLIQIDNSKSGEPVAKIQKKSDKSSGKIHKKRCNFKVSMKKGTFFEKSKLPIDTVCKFVVFWCCMKHPTQEFLRNELSLATRTVVDWSTACREICIHWAKSVSEKIGGDGVLVQVDEVKVQESKEHKTNEIGNKFSFWGMEKDKERGKIFIVPVPACDSWSLLNVINDWILPGSVIISNCWKAYDCLKLQEFVQQTIVQSKTFVHPQSSIGQTNLDSKSNTAEVNPNGEYCMPKFGTRRSHHLGDLAEFMFKRRFSNHLERMHAFFRQISLAYPLH